MAFAVDARALIPRPETEVLVDLALGAIGERLAGAPRPPGTPPLAVADVGTGSGAIAVALAVALRRRGMLGEVEIVASDASAEAADLARENAVAQARGGPGGGRDGRPAAGRRDDRRASWWCPPASTSSAPTCPTSRRPVVPGLPVAASFEPRGRARRGPGRARRDPAPARGPAGAGRRPPASRSWRSATSRARRSARPRRSGSPAGTVRLEPDLAGTPRVAVLERRRSGRLAARPRSGVSGRRIRLVALDLDGTLIGDDLRLPPRTVATIRAAVARGVHVALVTGRMTSSALPYARELGLRAPLVGLQGALVREMPAPGSARLGRLLLHRPLPADVARDAIAWCRAAGLDAPREPPRADGDPGRRRTGRRLLALELRAGRPRARPRRRGSAAPVTKVIAVGPPPLPGRGPGARPGRLRRPRRPDGEPPDVPGVPGPGRQQGARRPVPGPAARAWTCATRSRSATSATTSR